MWSALLCDKTAHDSSGLQSEPLVIPSSSALDTVPLDEQLQKRWSFTNPAILEGLTNDNEKYIEKFKHVRRSIPISDQKLSLSPSIISHILMTLICFYEKYLIYTDAT